MVGLCRLELQTSCVSSRRSNQLSYGPLPIKSIPRSKRFDSRISISHVRLTTEPCQGSALVAG